MVRGLHWRYKPAQGPETRRMPGRLLTLDEAAELLGTTPLLVEQWVTQGVLHTTLVLPERVLRLSRQEVLAVAAQRVTGQRA